MPIENVSIRKYADTWEVAVSGDGYIGKGEGSHLADAVKLALNNWLMYLRLKRSD
jgi:hypothetical protein